MHTGRPISSVGWRLVQVLSTASLHLLRRFNAHLTCLCTGATPLFQCASFGMVRYDLAWPALLAAHAPCVLPHRPCSVRNGRRLAVPYSKPEAFLPLNAATCSGSSRLDSLAPHYAVSWLSPVWLLDSLLPLAFRILTRFPSTSTRNKAGSPAEDPLRTSQHTPGFATLVLLTKLSIEPSAIQRHSASSYPSRSPRSPLSRSYLARSVPELARQTKQRVLPCPASRLSVQPRRSAPPPLSG